MKKSFIILLTILFMFGVVGAANAIPYTDVYDPGGLLRMDYRDKRGSNSMLWEFDITDSGFNPATQDVISASVTLSLLDDRRDPFPWIEVATIDFGTNKFFWEVNSGDVSFVLASLITLSDYGQVTAELNCIYGDFYFDAARLDAEGTEPISAHAAEPGSMFMFGTGLIGVGLIVRKKFRKV